MTKPDAEDRLAACPGVSVAIAAGLHPREALNGMGHLSIQTSGYTEVNLDEALPLLHDLAKTFDLEFIGPVSDKDLRHLVGLRNILSLKLNRSHVTAAGLRHLAGLTSLRILELSGMPITAAGLSQLAGLANLCELHLGWTQADDESVQALSGLPRLTRLDLSGCPVTDRCLEHLSRLTTLRSLSLSGTKIKGAGLPLLERLGSLERLDLDLLPVTDREAAALARLGKLQSLSLHGTQVGDEGASWLVGLPGLCWLTLSETRIGDEALRHLRACEKLINVRLDGTRVTGAGLACLPKNLAVLSLTGVEIEEEDLAALEHLESLSTLVLDERVADDAAVGRLRRMHLARCPAYDEGMAAFSRLPACPLCQEVIEEDSRVFVPRPFFIGPEFWQYAKMPIHWDCFARWEKRSEFARRYFQANAEAAEHNQFWGVARRDEQVLVSVNPSQYVQEVEVLLAETGSSFRIPLTDWQGWLEGEWFDACGHEVEREALAGLIPSLRAAFPTPEGVVEAAGFSSEEPSDGPDGMVGQVSYEFACQNLARRAAEKGLVCPLCGAFSIDYEYRRVEVVDPDGPRSVLVCKNCGGEFGPDDV